ncbi:cation diffusion facilitator family transporter [Rhodohalobacter barkolensis]|uniref:Cation transporter n=1 Tax=Rhodohalobacter barkolensis TaxID=2053187 RepID=A0A2N0VE15_9BACT|nr:cation diffusion facilitator family transporter [Rhodohalobacter barkolensis]PKD42432.1 cation transporter [Rhodohalobacter barkolensis]
MTASAKVKNALRISLIVSFLSLAVKVGAFLVTDSTTAMSDAAESIVHVLAVGFVLYGYHLSLKPADDNHLYGHERIEFLSVGVEGVVIILAGITILFLAIQNLITGFELQSLDTGIYMVGFAAVVNLVLGLYVQKVGREENSMIAISNGKHVLTDVWTSGGVILTLFLISITGWIYLDTIVSISIAFYISYEGFKLIRYSVDGIMDARNPAVHDALETVLNSELPADATGWHHLRHRTSGYTTWVELHVTFKKEISLQKAHDEATVLERKLIDALKSDAIVTIHLEPEAPHDELHKVLKGANKNQRFDDFV